MKWSPPKTLLCDKPQSVDVHFNELLEKLAEADCTSALQSIAKNNELEAFLRAVISFSPYLRDLMLRHPSILSDILREGFASTFDACVTNVAEFGLKNDDEASIMAQLRHAKSTVALLCALADLGGWWNAEKVTYVLARFADVCLNAAFDFIFRSASQKQQFDVGDITNPQNECGLIVLAMGKHGACELNYSSDIDLILFYNEQAAARVQKTDPTTFFARVAKQLVKLLQQRTSDGYVFRVDLRLRPDPSSTPAIMPLESGLIYYESYGQNWERAAMIKARPAAGDARAGEQFLSEIRPFIWRKYLDYAAIQDVHSIKRQIHAYKGHATIATHGHNIKLGRGGIREIEFFAQTQQLIAGGRIPQLRTLRTIETLAALCQHEWISQLVVDELTNAYWFLRDVEHRLQMVADEQNHTLPLDEDEFTKIALMMGYQNSEGFSHALTEKLETVERHYSSLFEQSQELSNETGNLVFTGDVDDPQTIETLSLMGYLRPTDIIRTIKGWHFGRYPALRTSQARELLTELTPHLLQEFARTGRADDTLIAMDRFIQGLPAGIQLFALLNSNQQLQHLLTLLLSAAPRLADVITRRPHVFDGLLDPSFSEVLPNAKFLDERLTQFLSKSPDYETILDRARIFAAEQKFLIGVRLLNGSVNAVQAGCAYSQLAQVMINAMLDIVTLEFENKHGAIEGGKICVLAMGRLGSRELTAGSDLDLILLYNHAANAQASDGAKPLDASQYYTRLTQRLTAAMCAPTAQGVIYELDFRLRPSGNAGPLATQSEAFMRYQKHEAWTWEHQALTRVRPVAGSSKFCNEIDAQIAGLIATKPRHDNIKSDIAQMRARIDKQKGSKNPYNCKNVKGGLIDVEFISQWLVLDCAQLPKPDARNPKAIIAGARKDLLNSADRDVLLLALELYTNILQILSACLEEEFEPKSAPAGLKDILCRTLGLPNISTVTTQLEDCQKQVSEIFARVIG